MPLLFLEGTPPRQNLPTLRLLLSTLGTNTSPSFIILTTTNFPRDADPSCALSLVLQSLGMYEDTKEFCSWLETTEWFDCRGPHDTADWLGVDREAMAKLNSPLDVTLFKAFARQSEHQAGEPVWEVMKMIGTDLVDYVTGLRQRMDEVAKVEEIWEVEVGESTVKVAFVPRTEPLIEDASGGLAWRIKELGLKDEVVAMIYPDSRGSGYGMRRFDDNPAFDFCRLAEEPDVHFTHNRGFIAKTSCTDITRLQHLLEKAGTP